MAWVDSTSVLCHCRVCARLFAPTGMQREANNFLSLNEPMYLLHLAPVPLLCERDQRSDDS
eukprot:443398-Rhodomonas_salina.1